MTLTAMKKYIKRAKGFVKFPPSKPVQIAAEIHTALKLDSARNCIPLNRAAAAWLRAAVAPAPIQRAVLALLDMNATNKPEIAAEVQACIDAAFPQ